MTFAKGVTSGYQPLSGVIVSGEVAAELSEPGFLLRSGYTYAGHPAACAAAVANINLIESDGLIDRANHVGKKTVEGFDALVADGIIKSYRGVGAVWAAEIGQDSTVPKATMRENGVIVRGVGESIIWCPPLIVTDDEIATLRASIFEPIEATASGDGPIHVRPASTTAVAKSVRSDRKPYPG